MIGILSDSLEATFYDGWCLTWLSGHIQQRSWPYHLLEYLWKWKDEICYFTPL